MEERGNGWGITLQWAKPELEQCISKELFEATRSLTVDPEMTKKDPESYKFLNPATLQRKYLPLHIPTDGEYGVKAFENFLQRTSKCVGNLEYAA